MSSIIFFTFNRRPFRTSVRTPIRRPIRTPASAACRPLSNAFNAFLDALFFSLEPAVDKALSHRIGDRGVAPCKHPYAAFDAPAYRRRGRLIPELDRSNL
jgi:hypothetical protein